METKRIGFLMGEGFMASSVYGPMDALSIANALWVARKKVKTPLFEPVLVGAGQGAVSCAFGAEIRPGVSLAESNALDMLVVGAFQGRVDDGLHSVSQAISAVKALHEKGCLVASTCTGAFVLAEAGILDGRSATTHWKFASAFRRRYPRVRLNENRVLVEEAGVITTGATTAWQSLVLRTIEIFGSVDLAAECAKVLLIDAGRAEQTPYMDALSVREHGDEAIGGVQAWLEAELGSHISVENMAEKAGLGLRTFIRRFKKATSESPLVYLQTLRIQTARHLLETTRQSVDEITWAVGYEDTSSFRRLFKRTTGLTPREYRDRFSSAFVA